MYSTLFIDFDNTIVDYFAAENGALFKLARDYRIEDDRVPELVDVYKAKNKELWEQFERKKISIPEITRQRFEYLQSKYPELKSTPDELNEQYLNAFVNATKLDQEVQKILEKLADKYSVIIVSNGIHDIQTRRLEKVGLFQLIDGYVTSQEAGAAKPETAMFELAMQKLKSLGKNPSKEQILMIGDSKTADYQGAINFGIDFCWISEDKEHIGKYTISSFVELEKILL
ncbi:MAG: noncanonical pyrimidine nucleotidase, YjjG family [Candidatus Heimdallarchaeota archaeon]|nr:noncanonical pyrimidine nucleotidase, YjjG family [Candidatus Heimdallarchaeota archaeon]